MCDTFVATPGSTRSGNMVFGKNSDREPNEAQAIVRIPRAQHREGPVRLTYISVPQARETHSTLLSKPFQMWGAEMGANEHGLCIGNEALFTRVPMEKSSNQGLTGMDLLRLALERAKTAESALEVITALLEEHGQDACGGYRNRGFFYHNGFILADARDAYVLETAGRHWAAVKVKGYRAISNGITIRGEYDFSSKDLVSYAHAQGWIPKGREFSFSEAYSDPQRSADARCHMRQSRSTELGSKGAGGIDIPYALDVLRDHAGESPEEFDPRRSHSGYLCMHATGGKNLAQTTGGWASEIRVDRPSTHWISGTAASCISLFKPFFFPGSTLGAEEFAQPGPKPDSSLWWRHEKLHRKALEDYAGATQLFRGQLLALQADWIRREAELFEGAAKPPESELERLSRKTLEEGDAALASWTNAVSERVRGPRGWAPFYRWHWGKLERELRGS